MIPNTSCQVIARLGGTKYRGKQQTRTTSNANRTPSILASLSIRGTFKDY